MKRCAIRYTYLVMWHAIASREPASPKLSHLQAQQHAVVHQLSTMHNAVSGPYHSS
jgi:hypothetical protein